MLDSVGGVGVGDGGVGGDGSGVGVEHIRTALNYLEFRRTVVMFTNRSYPQDCGKEHKFEHPERILAGVSLVVQFLQMTLLQLQQECAPTTCVVLRCGFATFKVLVIFKTQDTLYEHGNISYRHICSKYVYSNLL